MATQQLVASIMFAKKCTLPTLSVTAAPITLSLRLSGNPMERKKNTPISLLGVDFLSFEFMQGETKAPFLKVA